MKRSGWLVVGFALAACAAPNEGGEGLAEDDVTAGEIEEMFIPISNLELSTTRSAKVAQIKYRGRAEIDQVTRCHQSSFRFTEIIVCRDEKIEIVMDASHAFEANFKRFARVRFADGRPAATFLCPQVSAREFNEETYGGMTGHRCKPESKLTEQGKTAFEAADAAPVLEKHPTRKVFLPTLWAKQPAEKWSDWSDEFAKAAPVGEYVGYGRSSSKPCKVKITEEGDGYKVAIHSLDASGAEGKLQAQAVLSSQTTYGAFLGRDISQEVASTARPASVLIANSETETTTKDYYARNVRVVRFPDAPANADAGHSAVFVDDDYCQRLSPAIPAW